MNGAPAESATVDGRSVLAANLARPGPVEVRVMDGSDGLDGLPGFVPRPPGFGLRGSRTSELLLVAKTHTI